MYINDCMKTVVQLILPYSHVINFGGIFFLKTGFLQENLNFVCNRTLNLPVDIKYMSFTFLLKSEASDLSRQNKI